MKWLDTDTQRMLLEQIPLPREQLAQIHLEAARRWRRDRRFSLALFPLALAGPAAIFLGRSAFPTLWGLKAWRIGSFVIGWLLLILLMLAFSQAMRPRYKHHLWGVLREGGYEVCTTCGYWLHELADDIVRCPECGAKREPMAESSTEAGPDDRREEGPGGGGG